MIANPTAGTFTVDTIAPTVSSATPANSATSVPINQNVVVQFSETMDTSTTPALTQTAGTDPDGWSGPTWTATTNTNDTATWTHNDWNGLDSITIQVSAGYKDLVGNTGNIYFWSFTTTGNAPPTVTITSASQRTDGTGIVDINIEANDDDQDDCRVKVYYGTDTNCPNKCTLTGTATADIAPAPDINNSNPYQVGDTTPIKTTALYKSDYQ
jgi:hypothetical protein